MHHHHDSIVNIPLAFVLLTMPWWLHVFESTSWLAGKLTPIGALLVIVLQVWLLVKKLWRH